MRWHTRQSIELGTFGGHMDVLGPAAGEHRGNLLVFEAPTTGRDLAAGYPLLMAIGGARKSVSVTC